MATLTQIRDLLALRGRMEARQISETLNAPLPLVVAMLERLEAMGRATRVPDDANGCLSGSCRSCPEGQRCLTERWMMLPSPSPSP